MPAVALDCPLLRDNSAPSWAASFRNANSTIFEAKITNIRFVGMDDWPVYSVHYSITEVLKGTAPKELTADLIAWCDACNVDQAIHAYDEWIGRSILVQGNLALSHLTWSFEPAWCWGFVQLPFQWARGDILAALRDQKDGVQP